jgi:preprotein translocase subunit SecB
MTDSNAASTPAAESGPQVLLQKIYLKDASLELPQAPMVFTRSEQPSIDLQINTSVQGLGNDNVQVTLAVTVTAKLDEATTAFLIEVHQAGIFRISGFNSQTEIDAVLGIFCPQQLLPFAREAVADLVQRAGFPPLLLQPVNFEALYAQHRNAASAAASATAH